jgi:hypothetical protein
MTASASAPGPQITNAAEASRPEVLVRSVPAVVEHATDALATSTRAALALPTDRAIVMSGHQADLWHCGILAKWFAMHPIASRASAHAAWIVVDHDTNDPTSIAYPSRGEQGPVRAAWKWGGESAVGESLLPTRLRASRTLKNMPSAELFWSPTVHDAMERAHTALHASANASDLAEQLTRAGQQLLAPVTRATPSIVMARRIGATPVFRSLVRTMLKDPVACVEAYNAAAVSFPKAGIRSLECKADRVELPLWSIQRSRRPLFAADRDCSGQDLGPEDSLAPRALMLSAVLRLAVCDLFIHGMGGGEYDKVTDAWLSGWLTESSRGRTAADPELRSLLDQRLSRGAAVMAPSMVVSATVRLAFPEVVVPTPEEIDRTIWLAHAGRHRLLGEPDASLDAARKRALVAAVDAARRDSAGVLKPRRERRAALTAYRELHAALAASRAEHASALAELDRNAAAARAARGIASIVHDRTWSFALHSKEALEGLRNAVEAAL